MQLIKRMTITKQALDALREEGVVADIREVPCPKHVESGCTSCMDHGSLFEVTEYPLSLEDA